MKFACEITIAICAWIMKYLILNDVSTKMKKCENDFKKRYRIMRCSKTTRLRGKLGFPTKFHDTSQLWKKIKTGLFTTDPPPPWSPCWEPYAGGKKYKKITLIFIISLNWGSQKSFGQRPSSSAHVNQQWNIFISTQFRFVRITNMDWITIYEYA